MAQLSKAERAAQHLFEAHRQRLRYEALPADISPGTIDEAYDMQEAVPSAAGAGTRGHSGLQDCADHACDAANGGFRRPLRRRRLRERRASFAGIRQYRGLRPPRRRVRGGGPPPVGPVGQRRALRPGPGVLPQWAR